PTPSTLDNYRPSLKTPSPIGKLVPVAQCPPLFLAQLHALVPSSHYLVTRKAVTSIGNPIGLRNARISVRAVIIRENRKNSICKRSDPRSVIPSIDFANRAPILANLSNGRAHCSTRPLPHKIVQAKRSQQPRRTRSKEQQKRRIDNPCRQLQASPEQQIILLRKPYERVNGFQ